MPQDQPLTSSKALKFVLIMGIVNLLADMTHEEARSVNGAYLQTLGASAAAMGFTAGFGELIGYGFRSAPGKIPPAASATLPVFQPLCSCASSGMTHRVLHISVIRENT
jgi:hypothetical protein